MTHALSLKRIAYDPASYYDPWRGRIASMGSRRRATLNRWLFRRYGLVGPSSEGDARNPRVVRLVQAWSHIRAAAYLMACARHGPAVMARRDYLRQPPAVQAFIRLGFPTALQAEAEADRDTLFAWGGAAVVGLAPNLPPWLGQRLPLHFASRPPVATHVSPIDGSSDFTVFLSALTYAERDPSLRHFASA